MSTIHTIYIFGPSCSGKSTLGKKLQKLLGNDWLYIDRDDLIEKKECSEESADQYLDEKIKAREGKGTIIDAQIPWREKSDGEFFVLLLPPLKTLLNRNNNRTKFFNRNKEHHKICEDYVIETYYSLISAPSTQFDAVFDSGYSKLDDIANDVTQIINEMLLIKPDI
ncbi:TPA: AAA family ATPase [Legionella pneumophila]|nr:AAA family ATPase [Legionella pneumophila]HAU1208384.1 AAA family ATPase [Legionella pneumophila]HAU1284976.1 AAA family ATPase [Legionella pneumophila]HAU1962591.1 AAA family ATPase [Legionella pneumophila]